MRGDSLINVVSVMPLEFVQNYWVIPLLMGACSFGIRERERERWGKENIVVKRGVLLNALVLVFGFGGVWVLLHPAKQTLFFSLSCFLHKFDPWYSHFCSTLHNSPFITSFVFFFFRGLYMIQQRLKKLLGGISKEWIYRICFVFEIFTLILVPLIQKEVRISWQKA